MPNEPGKVAMYTCGPTVYHYAHIGNLRSYIMEDVLEKYFRYSGLDVKRVMNITDVGILPRTEIRAMIKCSRVQSASIKP